MNREQVELLKRIQALQFTAVDFNLYLDTHPADQRALVDYANTIQELEPLRQEYIRRFGPLLPRDAGSTAQGCWDWIEEPWPWEIDY